MTSTRVTIIAVLLVAGTVFAATSLAAQHDGQDGTQDGSQADGNQTGGPGGDQAQGGDGGPPEQAQERREQARQRAAEAGLFGTLTYDTETSQADGRFVSFGLDEGSALVRDFTLKRNGTNLTVFDAIQPDTFHKTGPVRAAGSTLHLDGEQLRLQAFDNPNGLLKYQAQRNLTVTAGLTPDVSATDPGNSSRIVDISGPGNFSGTLVVAGNGTATVGDGNVTLDLQRAGVVLFRADPANATEEERELDRGLDRAASEDRLGATARIAGVNGTPAQQNLNLSVNASAQEATDGRVRVEVDGDRPEGKVVHLSIARGNLNVSTPDEAAVQFDGDEVPVVDDVDEVVNATQGDDAKAHVVVTNQTARVTVWVPDFSLHTITTKDATQDLADLPTPTSAPNPTGAATSFADQAAQAAQAKADRFRNVPQEARDQATSRASQAGVFGSADLEAGGFAGTFAEADVSPSTGTVTDLAVEAGDGKVTVLSELAVDPFTAAGEAQAAGPVATLPGSEAAVVLQDTPSADVQVKAGDESVQADFTLPSEADVTRLASDHLAVEVDGVQAHLVLTNGNGDLVVQGETVTANLGANAGVLFTVHPAEDVAEAPNFRERLDALKRGDLGGQAGLAAAGDQAIGADTSVAVDVAPAQAGAASVSSTVSSNVPDPRAVVLTIPKEDLDVDAASEVDVSIDGQPASEAASVDQILATTANGDAYATTDAGDAVQVAVQVSGFSDHTVTASGDSADDGTTTTGNGVPAGATIALLAGLGAAVALSGKRRRR